MVLIREEYCLVHQRKTAHYNGECGECQREAADKKLREWSAKPIEEKLDFLFLELEKLKRGEPRY